MKAIVVVVCTIAAALILSLSVHALTGVYPVVGDPWVILHPDTSTSAPAVPGPAPISCSAQHRLTDPYLTPDQVAALCGLPAPS